MADNHGYKGILLITILSTLLATGLGVGLYRYIKHRPSKESWQAFENWAKENNRSYSYSEKYHRFRIFEANTNSVNAHQANKARTYNKEINKFGDWTKEEFIMNFVSHIQTVNSYSSSYRSSQLIKPRASYALQNAQSCHSGYSQAIATALGFATKKDLSTQQLIDCTQSYGNKQCRGGNIKGSLQYIKKVGLQSASTYSFTGENQECQLGSNGQLGDQTYTKIKAFKAMPAQSNYYFSQQLKKGPIVVALDASDMMFYKDGVYDGANCSTEDRPYVMVALPGDYLNDAANMYYEVKSSFGADWGVNGVIKMLRTEGTNAGTCGMLNEAYSISI